MEATHSLNFGTHGFIPILHENRRLYKFLSWKEHKNQILEYIKDYISKVSEIDISDIKLDIEAANPMRRSRFGNFYINVKGKVTLYNSDDFDIEDLLPNPNIPILQYKTLDENEINRREEIEKSFGVDQFTKYEDILSQVLHHIVADENGGTLTLNTENEESIDSLVEKIMSNSGWVKEKDNRIHSRINRLPSWVVVPE